MAEVVAICDHLAKLKFSPVLPNAFTEHGAIMVADVLNSSQAVRMSVDPETVCRYLEISVDITECSR